MSEKESKLNARSLNIDQEADRKANEKIKKREADIRREASAEHYLKLKEKDKTIDDLKKTVNEANQGLSDGQRRSQLGSQELQGEVLEEDIQEALMRQFPEDHIVPVPKGIAGADIVQQVCNERGEFCGKILWEIKNTKNWQPAWLKKAKEDQHAAKADMILIVSVALPNNSEIKDKGHALIDDVWVTGWRKWSSLIVGVRYALLLTAPFRNAVIDKDDKMAALYHYLTGSEFRHRVEVIIEAWEALDIQVKQERRFMERNWSQREKQLRFVIQGTEGMYGDLQAITRSELPTIPTLEIGQENYEENE